MSVITEVMKRTGATRADIVRVATHGGTTTADWDIAIAIADITRRPADQIMWGHSGASLAPSNPRAEYDPSVTIYTEDANGLVTDTPETAGQDDTDEPTEAEQLATEVHADVAAFARSKYVAARIVKAVAAAGSLIRARLTLYRELATNPRTSLFSLHPEPVALAA